MQADIGMFNCYLNTINIFLCEFLKLTAFGKVPNMTKYTFFFIWELQSWKTDYMVNDKKCILCLYAKWS